MKLTDEERRMLAGEFGPQKAHAIDLVVQFGEAFGAKRLVDIDYVHYPAEMSIYHSSGHRYALRTDGFVSVRAGSEPGELLTKPITFDGNALYVNVSTSAAGDLRVEFRDAGGTPVPGFGLSDCVTIVGDSVRRRVEWQGGSDPGDLRGKAVRLRFAMRECDLYSFRFSGE